MLKWIPAFAGMTEETYVFVIPDLIGNPEWLRDLMFRNFKVAYCVQKVGPDSLVGPSFGRAAGHGGPAIPSETDKVTRRKAAGPDLAEACEFLRQLMPRAGEVLKKYFISRDFTSIEKTGVDFKTQADDEADILLRENIGKRYPGTRILSEETAPDDYSSLQSAEHLWVIDPLDGTINFSRGNPHFSISVALIDRGRPKLGVIHVPMTGEIYYAQANKSSACLNDNPIRVSLTKNLREAVLACDWGWDLAKRQDVARWLSRLGWHVRQIKSMGSAVADLAALACGKIDVYIHSGIKPWDVAAAALLIEKAGGRITTPSGKPWNVFCPDMVASNGILHDKILELMNKRKSF